MNKPAQQNIEQEFTGIYDINSVKINVGNIVITNEGIFFAGKYKESIALYTIKGAFYDYLNKVIGKTGFEVIGAVSKNYLDRISESNLSKKLLYVVNKNCINKKTVFATLSNNSSIILRKSNSDCGLRILHDGKIYYHISEVPFHLENAVSELIDFLTSSTDKTSLEEKLKSEKTVAEILAEESFNRAIEQRSLI